MKIGVNSEFERNQNFSPDPSDFNNDSSNMVTVETDGNQTSKSVLNVKKERKKRKKITDDMLSRFLALKRGLVKGRIIAKELGLSLQTIYKLSNKSSAHRFKNSDSISLHDDSSSKLSENTNTYSTSENKPYNLREKNQISDQNDLDRRYSCSRRILSDAEPVITNKITIDEMRKNCALSLMSYENKELIFLDFQEFCTRDRSKERVHIQTRAAVHGKVERSASVFGFIFIISERRLLAHKVISYPYTQLKLQEFIISLLLDGKLNKNQVVVCSDNKLINSERMQDICSQFEIDTIFLPPSTPQFNPGTKYFYHLQQTIFANEVFKEATEFEDAVQAALNRIHKNGTNVFAMCFENMWQYVFTSLNNICFV